MAGTIPRCLLLRAAAVTLALVALSATIAFAVMRPGPPAQLVSNLSDAAGNVLINNTRPIMLPVEVLDGRGRVLDPHQLRYKWIEGTMLGVSPDGIIQCHERGDAVVRATVGTLSKNLAVRCRPVSVLRAATWLDLIAGGAARDLPFEGLDPDEQPVGELRARISVADSTVATLEGASVRPLAVGQTTASIVVGDKKSGVRILVNEQVTSFDHLRPDQIFVARRVRLAQGDTVRWPLTKGVVWLKYIPARDGDAPPTIDLQGDAQCQLANPLQTVIATEDVIATLCAVNGPASIELAHGKMGAPFVEGFVMLDRTRGSFSTSRKR